TEPKIVMADSHTTRNVESPLVWSVVDPSTTGVDASKSTSTSDAPGDSPSNTTASPNTNPTTSTTTDSSNPEIRKNDGQTETGGGGNLDSKDGARSGEVGSDVDRSGSASPTKSDRKLATKKLSFKPVSLNRAFLGDAPATTAAPASMSSALQSKGTGLSTGLSLAAPRPIATSKLKLTRSGSSSQTSRPTLGSGGIGSGGGNSQPVWNKNQPTPPPPKKEFTDEELSKKYGIHLASRLGSDDTTNKEAKWADIDDDDDDWVPTTIEWNDGMKATIPDAPPAVPTPEPVGEPAKEPVKPPAKEPAKEPIKDAIRELTLVTQKPGTKTLQTTPVPPTVRQSPWAKLPPINPAPPVQVSPTLNSRRPLDNASHRVEREPPVVREVSAEVYDRSWRDRNGAQGNRELFNSQTGKMEPVPDDRRPAHSPVPKPAVLQRPAGPPQQSGGPAEPSAAFQTGRSSHRPDDFRRRRTSSNVSGGSGSVGRRLSFTRFAGGDPPTPDDMGFARDRPMYSNPFDEHGPPQRHPVPVPPQEEPEAQPQVQPETQPQPPQIPEESAEDLLAKQERVMREAREMARKRKKEEEEREEAAKKERLRVKLEALERLDNEKEAARKAEEERERIAKQKQEAEEAERRLAEEREKALVRERESAKATAEAEAQLQSRQHQTASSRNDPSHSIVPSERSNFAESNNSGNNFPGSNSGYPNNNRNPTWKSGATNPRGNNNTQWGSSQSSSPWGAVGDGSRPGVNSANNNMSGNVMNNSNNNRPVFDGPRPGHDGSRDRHSDRRTPSPTSGPLGAISRDDRDQAVNRWNMLPSQIDADAAAAREINHAARLAREAEEAATGIKKQTPTINYDIVEEFNEYQLDETGPKRAIEASKVGAGISPSEEVNNKLAAILMAHNHHHRQHDEAGSETHKIGKLPENTIAIPKGPAGTKPSRFFPTQANKTIAEHIAEHMKQNEEIAKPADAKLGQAGYRKNDNPVQRSFSPPPPMSADHPVHGATKIARVQLPGGAGMHTGGEEPGHSGTMKRFEEVQRRILAGVPGHAAPAVLGPPGLFKEGRDRMTVASKPSFDDTPEKQLKVPTVSLPCKVEESAGDVSMVTVLDSEEFITEFFQQDFGSTPNVRIPRPAHGFDVPAATNGRNTVKRAAVKDGVQSVPLYHPFGFKDFTNGQGEKFIPIQFPGGIRKEVAYNGQLFFPGSGSGGSGDKRGGRGFPKKRGGGRGGYAGGFGRKKAPEA
ncbi:hypothetical protein BZA05DRAFT_340181, partial [Tricharina praecox]|uniref:uncharacterized protein n=1 Tax=Tricharina praecox TaxID=43433 RepID=UPI00222097C7